MVMHLQYYYAFNNLCMHAYMHVHVGGLAQDIDLQSFLTNMLMKANLQEGLDYEDEDEKRRMEIENIDYPQEQDATNDDGDTEDLPLGDTDDDRYLAIQGEVLEG